MLSISQQRIHNNYLKMANRAFLTNCSLSMHTHNSVNIQFTEFTFHTHPMSCQ